MSVRSRGIAGLRAMARVVVISSSLVHLAGAWAQNARPEHPLANEAGMAAWWGDFEEFDRLYRVARLSSERSSTGETQVALVRGGFVRIFNGDNNDAYYAQVAASTAQWVAAHPDSALAHAMHARALYARAWFIRGGDYVNQVMPQAMAGFTRVMRLAEKELADHSALVMQDSTAHLYLIMIERSLGASFDVQWAIAQDGLAKDKDNDAIYHELVISSLPKWGGNADQLEMIATDAVKRTRADRGLSMYADIYLHAAFIYRAALFRETQADWARIKQGFEDFLKQYPDPVIVNRYAFVACLAQDKATTKALLDRIGDRPETWQWGGTDGVRAHQSCAEWAGSN